MAVGGPRIGAGHPSLPPELRRSHRVKCQLRAGEFADLRHIAEGWGVPVGTAAYAILSGFLGELRDRPGAALALSPDTLAVRASARILQLMGDDDPEPLTDAAEG